MDGAHNDPFGDTAEQDAAEAGTAMGPDYDQICRPALASATITLAMRSPLASSSLYLRCHACQLHHRLCLCQYFVANTRFLFPSFA